VKVFILLLPLVGALSAWAQNAIETNKSVVINKPLQHFGCCDASAGVAVTSNLFIVANDEDNSLRIYRRDKSGPAVQSYQAGVFLHVDPKKPETDLEGAATIGNRIYWITSHGRNREGEARESRHRFFATTFSVNNNGRVELKAVGQPYTRLLTDFINEPRLAKFGMRQASMLAPKEKGGLNIEGLCATTNGQLLIAFRNPIPNQRALIVPLKNPSEVVAGHRAQLGDPILLDLGNRGIRDIDWIGDRFLIIGGAYDGKGRFNLYEWNGGNEQPRKIPETHFKDMNPEALVAYPGSAANEFQILSDDGTRKLAGEDCKTVKDPSRKWFRSFWVTMPEGKVGR
jgi:hypothetical protein